MGNTSLLRAVQCALCAFVLSAATPASALLLVLSDLSSEPGTNPAADLDATVDFTISGGGFTLDITLTNTTSAPTAYNVNELYFSASPDITGLTYNSATHSAVGPVTANWSFNTSTGEGGLTHGDGFGIHDFSLLDGTGTALEIIEPTESVVFNFTVTTTGAPADMNDFAEFSSNTGTGDNIPSLVTVKFVSGPNGCPEAGVGNECDSAFGATVPEPGTATLLMLGLVGLAALRRRVD